LRKLRRSILDPPSQIQLLALKMANVGLSAAMRYRNSTGIESRPERMPFA
jgi:hypothetical protein